MSAILVSDELAYKCVPSHTATTCLSNIHLEDIVLQMSPQKHVFITEDFPSYFFLPAWHGPLGQDPRYLDYVSSFVVAP